MAALLSSSRRRRKERSCHFCGASKQADCDCGGWTRKDENGNLIEYLPQMSDPTLNSKPHLGFSIPRILTVSKDGGTSDTPSSPFCSTCLANQNLQLNLLANYLPGDSDPQNSQSRAESTASTRTLLDNLPAYKASLEARYPILCSTCSMKASEIIKERNYKVKAFSLNESVKRLAKPFQARLSSTRPSCSFTAQNESLPLSGMGGKLWTLQEWLWRIQGLVWLSCYLLRKNRAQGIRTKVIGKHHFLCLNIIACLLRLFLWFYYFNTGTRAFANARICDVSNSLEIAFLTDWGASVYSSLTVLKTDSPIGVRSLAKSNARRSLAQSTPTPTPTLAEHELFSTLSLARPTSSPLSEIDTFHSHTVAEGGTHTSPSRLSVEPAFGKLTSLQGKFTEPGTAWNSPSPRKDISGQMDMSMDWEPSPDRDSQSNDILLRPQTFLPPLPFREETGIEELFQSHVKLVEGDDHQLDRRKRMARTTVQSNDQETVFRNFKLWKNFKSLTTSHHQQSTLEYGTGSLADHVDYHCQVVGQILNNGIGDPSRTKVVTIGHSVGGYIATKVLERYPDQVMHIIGLFPTISHIARSPNGRRLSRLFSPILLPFINMLQIVVCLTLPKIALCWLIKKLYSPLSGTFDKSRPIKESEVVETQKKEMTISENNLMIILNFILNINSVSAVLKMARSEMESIRELDTKFIHQFHQKLTLFWTSHQADEWVGETEITEIVDILNPYNHHSSKESGDEHLSHRGNELRSSNEIPTWRRMDEGIPHAFCLKHNQVMAKECSLLIKNRLLSDT
ncbi:hypothetical protein H4Q26_008804 [Puccinia striiformis f. sp. tritici PST-130]|nr:hypothetical protein H4Q26_008804 [Puccinia striiformis f. sp. tritici PST-130]